MVWKKWTRRLVKSCTTGCAALSLAGLLGMADTARGQDAESVNRTYLNKSLIHLPIEIEGNYRAQISSLVLFVKEGAGGQWAVRDKAAPMQTSFTFRAPRDGEYWFRIVAVDNQGKSHPDDLAKDIQDCVVVIVDSAPPTLDVVYHQSSAEGHILQCEMRDANPDAFKTRFYYQTRDSVWRALDPLPNQPNTFCVPAQAALTNFIRVIATDLAGNSTARTLNLSELAATPKTSRPAVAAAIPAPPPIPQAPTAPPSGSGIFPGALANAEPIPMASTAYQPPVQPAVQPPPVAQTPPIDSAAEPRLVPVDYRVASKTNVPLPTVTNGPLTSNTPIAAPAPSPIPEAAPRPTPPPSPPASLPEFETSAGTLAHKTASPSLQLVGTTQVLLNYAVENVGASGVGRMEIYATRDRGQSWHKITEDTQRRNPIAIDLPEEGVYGLKLIATNGRGFGGQAPQPGDPADWWVEVDTTKPRANITGVQPGAGKESGSLTVVWAADDKNLADGGIDLYHAPSREGPWSPIAKNLKNTGAHRWTPSPDLGAHAFIRLVARDKAGNSALSETLQPVPLDDQSRPRVRLIGVTATPPGGVAVVPTGIVPVQTTNVPVTSGVRPVNHSSSLGVEVR